MLLPWCYSLHPDIIYHCNVTYSTLINTSALLKKDFCFNSVLDIQSFWILTVYQLKDRGITQFEFSTLISCYVNFLRDFLFVILGFVLLGHILFWLAIIYSNFERVNINFRFIHFIAVPRAEVDRCLTTCNVLKWVIKFIHSRFKFCIQLLVVKQRCCLSIKAMFFIIKCISQRLEKARRDGVSYLGRGWWRV